MRGAANAGQRTGSADRAAARGGDRIAERHGPFRTAPVPPLDPHGHPADRGVDGTRLRRGRSLRPCRSPDGLRWRLGSHERERPPLACRAARVGAHR